MGLEKREVEQWWWFKWPTRTTSLRVAINPSSERLRVGYKTTWKHCTAPAKLKCLVKNIAPKSCPGGRTLWIDFKHDLLYPVILLGFSVSSHLWGPVFPGAGGQRKVSMTDTNLSTLTTVYNSCKHPLIFTSVFTLFISEVTTGTPEVFTKVINENKILVTV